MNRIISSLVLVVTGVVFNFLTGNILVSVIGCSLLGLMLNQKIFSQGKRDKTDLGIYPEEYLNRFQTLKDYVKIHDSNYEVYEDTVLDSVFIDKEGKIWSLGLETLDWYQLIVDDWVRAEPKKKMILLSETELTESA